MTVGAANSAGPRRMILAALALGGMAAALAAVTPPLWAAGALSVCGLGFLLFHYPRMYVYLFLIVALLPYSFLEYLNEFRLFGGSQAGVNLAGLAWVVNVVLFLAYTIYHRVNWWSEAEYRPYLLLLGLALANVLRGNNGDVGIRNWIHLAAPLCLALVLFRSITDAEKAHQTTRHLLGIFTVSMAVGGFQLLTGSGSYDVAADSFRLSGTFGENGEVTFAVILLYLICWSAPIGMLVRGRWWTGIMAAAGVGLLLASQSRTPLLALLAVTVLMLRQMRVRARVWLVLLVLAAACQFVPRVYSRFGGPLFSASAALEKTPDVYANLIQRTETWRMLSTEFLDWRTLLVGRGFGRVDYFLQQELENPFGLYTRAAHNEHLRLLVDLGIGGIGLLAAQLVVIWRAGSRLARQASDRFSQALGVSLPALAVSYATLAVTSNMYGVEAHTVVFWIPVALGLAASKWTPCLPSSPSSS
jgi:hypothetical protein